MAEETFIERLPGQEFAGEAGAFPNFDLKGYLTGLGFDVREHDSDGHREYAVCCPCCVERGEARADVKYRLWINAETGEFHCYNCEWGAISLLYLVRRLSQVDLAGAVRLLMGRRLDPLEHLSLSLTQPVVEPDEEQDRELREVVLPHGYTPLMAEHPYLVKRGIPLEYAVTHDWGYSDVGFTRGRIIVPTFMERRLVFWQARATWELGFDEKKVLNPSGVSAKGVLYQYDSAKEYEEIVVVEGFMDAAKVGPQAVATNGKRLHERQVEWLTRTRAKRITLLYDRDAWFDGRRRGGEVVKPSILRAADLLKGRFEVRLAVLPDDRDPGSYPVGSADLAEIIRWARAA